MIKTVPWPNGEWGDNLISEEASLSSTLTWYMEVNSTYNLEEKGKVNISRKQRQADLLPSRYREGKSPSGEITTGPSGRTFPSYNIENKHEIVIASLYLSQPHC